MATTMKLIGSVTLGADAATVTFSSIPGGFSDLLCLATARSDAASNTNSTFVRFNGAANDTNHTYRLLQGNGATASSSSGNGCFVMEVPSSGLTASTFSNGEIYIPNYAGSANKSLSATYAQETNATTAYIGAVAGLWSSTAAITDIEWRINGTVKFKSGSSFYLYAISRA